MTALQTQPLTREAGWPREADFILFTLETTPSSDTLGYMRDSIPHQVTAELRQTGDPARPPLLVYTRSVSRRGAEFITRERIPKLCMAELLITTPRGDRKTIKGVLVRCRPAALGWFEATLSFNAPEPA